MHRRHLIKASAGVAIWPMSGRAQQPGIPVVGFLSAQSPGSGVAGRLAGFLSGLAELHYVESQNVKIEYRWAEGHYDRLRALAEDLVGQRVTVIAALTQDAALAAKAVTKTIPIVFNVGGDPVRFGLAASLSRPGGNSTGVSMFSHELEAKRLGLLHDMVPRVAAVGVLVNPTNASSENQAQQLQDAGRSLGLQILVRGASSEREIDAGIEGLVEAGVRALLAGGDPFLASQRERLVALTARHSLPAMWEWPDFVKAGGLMSYGTSIEDNYRQAGAYTGRILKGESPGDLPVIRPVSFVLAVNLRTAKTLGIEVPATLVARADEVIE
jgi:putative ABC transport system substrate-binding protein